MKSRQANLSPIHYASNGSGYGDSHHELCFYDHDITENITEVMPKHTNAKILKVVSAMLGDVTPVDTWSEVPNKQSQLAPTFRVSCIQ